jgi:hypothetical protein
MSISVLFVGVFAISESAQQAKPALDSPAANSSYQMGVDVFGGMTQGGGQAVVWGGIAAVVLVALGFLVYAGSSGGR